MHVETGDSSEPGIDRGIWKGQGEPPPPGSRLNAFNCSIEVSNIDKSMAKVKDAGGSVVKNKAQIPGVGRLGIVRTVVEVK